MSGGSCAAFGPDGKLYVVEPFGGIIRMDLNPGNTQSVYSQFIPTGPSLFNDLAFDDNSNLYVTDSFAATIYRIPSGGGAPSVWFTDPRLAGDPSLPFGVKGIRTDKNNKNIYVSVTRIGEDTVALAPGPDSMFTNIRNHQLLKSES